MVDILVIVIFIINDGYCIIEFSGILSSFWGSSIWDSCSILDLYENSGEVMVVKNFFGNLNIRNNKFYLVVLFRVEVKE